MRSTRRLLTTLCLAAALVLALGAPAHAVVAAAVPGSFTVGFATPVVFTQVGGPVIFANGDVASHTLTASKDFLPRKVARKTKRCAGYPRDGCPLFSTPVVDSGEEAQVAGLKRVKAGKQYAFRCQIHSGMKGTLVVRP